MPAHTILLIFCSLLMLTVFVVLKRSYGSRVTGYTRVGIYSKVASLIPSPNHGDETKETIVHSATPLSPLLLLSGSLRRARTGNQLSGKATLSILLVLCEVGLPSSQNSDRPEPGNRDQAQHAARDNQPDPFR
jgi:hypothetical protein